MPYAADPVGTNINPSRAATSAGTPMTTRHANRESRHACHRRCCLGGSIRRLLFGHTARKSVNRIPGGTHETRHAIAFGCSAVLATAAVLAGCATSGNGPSGSAADSGTVTSAAPESNPAGDIPDTQAFVPFTPPGGLFTVSVPEGWARSTDGAATIFTDKANTVRIETAPRADAPTPSRSGRRIAGDRVIHGRLPSRDGDCGAAQGRAGDRDHLPRHAQPPNPVTGKTGTDAFERYEFWRNGHEVVLTLSGPAGADNVDPWRTITDSLQWTLMADRSPSRCCKPGRCTGSTVPETRKRSRCKGCR